MIATFKAGLVATALSAVALVPAAGIVTVASVDAAYAKNGGNGNGGGAREETGTAGGGPRRAAPTGSRGAADGRNGREAGATAGAVGATPPAVARIRSRTSSAE
jgi:hypothetical protein